MRLSTILTSLLVLSIYFLLFETVAAQNARKVYWSTTDNVIDTSLLRPLPRIIKKLDQVALYQITGKGKNRNVEVVPTPRDLEWLISRGDTLLLAHQHQSRSVLLQLLYQGPIRLYRVIQDIGYEQYFLVRGNKFYSINNANPREGAYAAIRQNCKTLNTPKYIHSDDDAVELARQLNRCLGANDHYVVWRPARDNQRISIAYDLLGIDALQNKLGKQWGWYGNNRHHDRLVINRVQPNYQKDLSINYERQAFRYWPYFSWNTDLSFLAINENINTFLVDVQDPIPAQEHTRLFLLYFSPGFNLTTNYYRRFRFFAGAGGVFILPIQAKRTIHLTDPNLTIPGKPITSTYKHIIVPEPAVYLQFGFHVKLHKSLQFGLRYRLDALLHQWRYYDVPDILYSEAFPNSTVLDQADHQDQLQFQFSYRW